MKYRVEKAYIPSMGSISAFIVNETPMETKEEYALWYLNTMRQHDGMPQWKNCPVKLTYTKIEEL